MPSQVVPGKSNIQAAIDRIHTFKILAPFANKGVTVIFQYSRVFEERLQHSTMSAQFPEYDGNLLCLKVLY